MREAAGFIVYHGSGGGRRFLLLRNARHGTWSFPKGHLDRGEAPRAGARRELLEETGIAEVCEDAGFEQVFDYVLPERGPGSGPRELKRLRLFLAEAPDLAWTRSDEHDDGGWFDEAGVRERLAFENLRTAFDAALRRLEGTA